MVRRSAGIVAYRVAESGLEVLLVHPGGPFWKNRDPGAWSIPKGEYAEGEDVEEAARREFAEETGWSLDAELVPLGDIRQKGGKLVTAFALEADFDPAALASNSFTMEWPPRSGRIQSFPEVDRVQWFGPDDAREKIQPSQRPILDALAALIAG